VLCSGAGDGHAGACNGDSGAPLVIQTPAGWLDVGILHGGDACAEVGYYDLYVRAEAIRGFALGIALARQPEAAARPRVSGHITAGARVSCSLGRWRGDAKRFVVQWTRAGTKTVLARGRAYTLTARDARRGVRCTVVASGPGGRGSATSYLSKPSTM
jgi:trypsin